MCGGIAYWVIDVRGLANKVSFTMADPHFHSHASARKD